MIEARIAGSVSELPAAEWDALAAGNPFVSHAFLSEQFTHTNTFNKQILVYH